MARFPMLSLGQLLTETWTLRFDTVGEESRCNITMGGARTSSAIAQTETAAALDALEQVMDDLRADMSREQDGPL